MDILFLGQQNWNVCWTAKQQFATRLSERGHRVLYVDPVPAAPGEPVPGDGPIPGLRRIGPRDLWVYTYVPVPALRWRLNRLRFPRMAPKVLRHLGFHAPITLCLHPSQFDWLERAQPRAVVYYAVDEYTAYGEMSEEERVRIRELENRLLGRADIALSLSHCLHERFSRHNQASLMLENGADYEHYQPERLARIPVHPAVEGLPGPRIGFFGQIDTRIDQALMVELARSRPDWQFVMAGRVKGIDPAALDAEPNIHLLGYQPYEDLPNVAAGIDAWIVPYVQNQLTHSCNPLKVYEYLATGRPVVSTPLDGLIACREAVALALGADEFRMALDRAVADPAAGREKRLEVAAANTWDARVDRLEEIFDLAVRRSLRRASADPGHALAPARRLRGNVRPKTYVTEHGQIRPTGFGRLQGMTWGLTRALGWVYYSARLAARLADRRGSVRVRSILVVRQGYLGDFVALLPALAALRRAYPQARITLGVQHDMSSAGLFRNCRDVDEVMSIEFLRTSDRLAQAKGLLRLFARGFDMVVAGGEPFVRPEGHLSGAPYYYGLHDGFPDQEVQGLLLGRDLGRHEADNNLALVEALTGAVGSDEDRVPVLPFPPDEIAAAGAQAARTIGLPAEGRLLLVHPGSQRASRRWPADRLAHVIERVLACMPDLTVLITGTKGERPLADDLRARLPAELHPRLRDGVGRTDLAGLIGLLDRASAVLCNDTGVMHLARSRGAPLVALLGPENPKVWGPHPLGTGPAVALRREVPCAPCRLDSCAAMHCMRSLPEEEVEVAVVRLLEAGRPPAGAGLQPVERRFRRLKWGDLARAGHALPEVTVAVFPEPGLSLDETLAGVLPQIERQTYPRVEILALAEGGAPGWIDRRSEERRRALPIRVVAAPAAGENAWHVAARHARGSLVAAIRRGAGWWPVRLSLDVAAAYRAPDAEFFADGRPVEGFDASGGTARRTALLRSFEPARGDARTGEAAATAG
jgi:ADP-heptose:LPS heptosyltransferase/glycosyltransferase involved in cell wall biosynthesis